ncbi:hypothetical protein GOP47_0024969 [Adiantum capillus-veneris]|uniref:AAA+ ATPase domain-containing protein n=1 Tax=Adiantum capillus-veneris TaxID=13818 RepID=A0A9D4Z446_ADICA|nr:hypothetical protein GOP47_0024969 [Adiantum capillus-veneris]
METKAHRHRSHKPISSCLPFTAAAQPLLPDAPNCMRCSTELVPLETTRVPQVKKCAYGSSISSVLCKRPSAQKAALEASCAPKIKKRAIQSGIMDFLAVPDKKLAAVQDKALAKSTEIKSIQAVSKVGLNDCTAVGKPRDFFKPLSKKQQNQSTNKLTAKCLSKPEIKEVQVDLQMEARLAAEENAQLAAGKPAHPFFSQQNVRLRAFSCDSSIDCTFSAPVASSECLSPAPPFHINQLLEVHTCKVGSQMWNGTSLWCERRKDQRVLTPGLPVKELDMLLRIPFSGSNPRMTSKSISQYITEEISLQPLESTSVQYLEAFLEDLEEDNKHKDKGEKGSCVFTEAVLKQRLKLFQSGLGKQCSGASLGTIPRLMTSESTSINLLWADVYQPYSLEQVWGNTEAVTSLSMWLQSWLTRSIPSFHCLDGEMSHPQTASCDDDRVEDSGWSEDDSDCSGNSNGCFLQNVLVLTGPVGCGKTAAIYACALLYGYNVIEVNCSENRSGPLIKQKFGESVESHRLGSWTADGMLDKELGDDNESGDKKNRAILLLEDVDVLFDVDRGFMAAVAQVAATAKRPIILTTNDTKLCIPHNLHARLLEFKRLSTKDLVALAYLVCMTEGFVISPQLLKRIVNVCNHDARKLLNYLQFWCQRDHYSGPQLTASKKAVVEVMKNGNNSEMSSHVKFQDGDPAAVTLLLRFEAQHRLWPVYMSTICQCDVTNSVANKLAELISKAERNFGAYQEKKLVQGLVRKRVLLDKKKRRRIDSGFDAEVDLSFEDDDEKNSCEIADAGSSLSESPVNHLLGTKNISPLPVARKRFPRLLAVVMSDSDEDLPCAVQEQPLQVGCHTPINQEPSSLMSIETSRDTDSTKSSSFPKTEEVQTVLYRDLFIVSADVKSEIMHEKSSQSPTQTCSSKDLVSSEGIPTSSQSITEAVDNLWSNFRKCSEKNDGLVLNAASKESLSLVRSLSVLADNLSACDIMSFMQCCAQDVANDTFKCSVCEDSECSNRLDACAQIANKAFQMCVQDSCSVPYYVGKIEQTVSVDNMLLAVNEPFSLGKLLTVNGHSNHNIICQAVPASEEHNLQRVQRRSFLKYSLSSEIPPKAHRLFQGTSFYECVSYLALMESSKQEQLASGSLPKRTRFCQSHKHPWNVSQNAMNLLQSFSSFGRPVDHEGGSVSKKRSPQTAALQARG